jgi:hypothetical protein
MPYLQGCMRNRMEVGDYGFAAGNMAHFAFSKTDTVLQVHASRLFCAEARHFDAR